MWCGVVVSQEKVGRRVGQVSWIFKTSLQCRIAFSAGNRVGVVLDNMDIFLHVTMTQWMFLWAWTILGTGCVLHSCLQLSDVGYQTK